MAYLYRSTKKDGYVAPTWRVCIKIDGKNRTIAAFKDKKHSMALKGHLEQLEMCKRSRLAPTPVLVDWLRNLDGPRKDKLEEWGLTDFVAKPESIFKAITIYRDHMDALGRSEKHRNQKTRMLKFICEGLGIEEIKDLNGEALLIWLSKQSKKNETGKSTLNAYLTAAKSFVNWAVATGRLDHSPLTRIKKIKVDDSKMARRPLMPAELAKLLWSSKRATDRWVYRTKQGKRSGVSLGGLDRYWLYRIAVETGFRKSTLAALTVGHVKFDGHPRIEVEAKYTKGGRGERQYLRPQTAKAIRAMISRNQLGINDKLLKVPHNTGDMTHHDCELAGIQWEAVAGSARIDFHSLRSTFISRQRRQGAALLQRLAAHQDIKTTSGYLARADMDDDMRQAILSMRGVR